MGGAIRQGALTMAARGKSEDKPGKVIGRKSTNQSVSEARERAKAGKGHVRELKGLLKEARKESRRARKQLRALERAARAARDAAKKNAKQRTAGKKVAAARSTAAAAPAKTATRRSGAAKRVLRPIAVVRAARLQVKLPPPVEQPAGPTATATAEDTLGEVPE